MKWIPILTLAVLVCGGCCSRQCQIHSAAGAKIHTQETDSDENGKHLTQMEMNQRAAAKADKAGAEMQKLCAEIRGHLDAEGRVKFNAAQTAWVQFSLAEAEYRADYYRGGSIMPLIYANSLTETTEQRISQLKDALNDLKDH